MAAWWTPYIRQRARQLGLDPRAVLAVASREGLSGRVGDGGHAFGPFQENDAGGILTGRPGNHRAFAESRAGVDDALNRIAQVARGLYGQQAIAAIVSRFERPANIPGEIASAGRAYGLGSFASGGASAGSQAPAQPSDSARSLLLQSLISTSQATHGGHTPDATNLLGALHALKDSATPAPSSPAVSTSTGAASGGHGIRELFYDPLGAVKDGKRIPAIGGHSDHVHLATANAAEMVKAIDVARRMGLSVAENPYVGAVHRVHVTDSNHYRVLGTVNGRKVGGAADVSGSPAQMARYFRWAARSL